nr:EOG090X0DYO [Eulimnadia texana]
MIMEQLTVAKSNKRIFKVVLTGVVSKEDWDKIMANNGWNSVDLRDTRYNQIIHLVSASKGAEHFYSLEHHSCRSEGLSLARHLDHRAAEAWIGHPYFDVIDNSTDFDTKLRRMINRRCFLYNNQYFQLDVFKEPCHPRCRGLVFLETYTTLPLDELAARLPNFLDVRKIVTGNFPAKNFCICQSTGEMFDDKLLRQALTHKSYILKETQRLKAVGIESGVENLNSNDSLADEGNIFLQKSLRGYLRSVLRKAPEECIEAIVDHLTSDQQLAIVSKHIGITDLMLCEDFPPADQTLAKSLKAVVAALEKSSGEDRARNFIYDFVVTQLYGVDLQELWNPTNPMGVLADILQRDGRGEPEPRLLRKAGSNTILAVYQVGIYSDRELVGSGFGESVEIAQEMAARDSLRRLFSLEDNALALPLGRQAQNLKSQAAKAEGQPNISVSQWSSEKVKNVVNC